MHHTLPGRSTFFPVLLLVACGGGADAHTAADEATTSVTPPPVDSTESAGGAAAPEAAPRESAPAAEASKDASLGEDDRKAVLQVVLDDEELGKYLRVGEPGRFPLKISGDGLPSGLTKMTKPVEVVSSPSPKAAVLVILEVTGGGGKAAVKYRYDVEGIQGTTTLEKGARGWEILRSRIVEHFRPESGGDGSDEGTKAKTGKRK